MGSQRHVPASITSGLLVGAGFGGLADTLLADAARWPRNEGVMNLHSSEATGGLLPLLPALLALVGVLHLWRSRRDAALASTKGFAGALLLGAGAIELVAAVVHHRLAVAARPGWSDPWGLVQVAAAAAATLAGAALIHAGSRPMALGLRVVGGGRGPSRPRGGSVPTRRSPPQSTRR